MALSSTYTVRAADPAAIRAQIVELEQELARLKSEAACASSGAAPASVAAAASQEQYRITYLGTIMVPASQVSGASGAGMASVQTDSTVSNPAAANQAAANLAAANLAAVLSRAQVVSNGARLTTRTGSGLGFNFGALSAATGQNARVSIPLSNLTAANLTAASGALNAANVVSAQNQPVAVRVSGAAIRAAAARLSAAERATRAAYPAHQVVNAANYTSGIYRGTQFTASPSSANPYVGRYVQTPDGQLNTVMPVGQQFIVLP
jgi:hypothetical protein